MRRLRARFIPIYCMLALSGMLALSRNTRAQAAKDSSSQSDKAAPANPPESVGQKSQPPPNPAAPKDPAALRVEERQAKILADTNKLYEMVQELKAEVSKSSKDELSVSVIKKAAEIEKLAKSLKERMRAE